MLHFRSNLPSTLTRPEHGLDKNKSLTREEMRLMRQEKLREFTEATKNSRGVRSNTARDRGNEPAPSDKHLDRDLSEFKRQFEAKHPERAAHLRHEMRPEHEKKSLSLITEFKRLEQIVEKGGRSKYLAQDHLEKLADKMSRQKDVMEYVREHHEPLSKQVNQLAKEFQRERDLGREL